jgi:hypothetical protein
MTQTPTPNFVIGGDQDHANNRPTASGGVSGPFRARRGFDAHKHKGVNFEAPDLPTNLANPSGDGEVVQTEFFWQHANFIRWDGRAGFLPDPLTTEIVAGESYAVRMDFGGRFLGRIAVWDGNLSGPAKAAIPAGSVYGVTQIFNLTDPALGQAELDGFVTITEQDPDRVAAGDYVLNSTGGSITVGVGNAAGIRLNDGEALLWMGDQRLGISGWEIVVGPNFEGVHTGAAAVGTTPGNWRYLNTLNWIKALAADPDQPTDVKNGDAQYTLQAQAKELKVWNDGAWHKVYSEVDVRAWIAALSLFEGTVQEVGGGAPNVLEVSGLPDLTLNTQIDKIAHYFVWQGSPGYVVKATDPNGVGRDLPGTILNPGDWLQVSNRSGDVNAPDLRWSHVGGDLLAKSRGDNLYGLKIWAAGGWEIGSLVVHDEAIWRATGPVVATDTAPGTAGAPWAKVNLAGGVRWVSLDSDLPATAPAGEIYFVLQSALAGGGGALYYWDNANSQWLPLGGAGGGDAMDLSSGVPIVNVGVPIGCIQIWPVANPPPGWLICDGAAFSAGTYPELAQVLGSTTLPNLVGQFIRGAGAGHTVGTRRAWTTGRPRNRNFETNISGEHNHWGGYAQDHNCWDRGNCGGSHVGNTGATNNNGLHSHIIDRGGDAETAPDHTCLLYIIKAADIATRVRI